MVQKGILTKWNDDKGYGFIGPIGEKKSIFVHVSEFRDRQRRPSLNRAVIFTLSSKNGKPCAINVKIDDTSSIVRKKGILTTWNDGKGYGFITPVGEKKEIFIHISEFQGHPLLNDRISFTLSKDKNGRDCAINAIKFDTAKITFQIKKTNHISIFSILIITIFYFILFYLIHDKKIATYTILYYLLMSVFTFYIYSKDKDFSQDGNWRISEQTLHLLSMMGGWLGALIAQDKLNHKSSKTNFRILFFITIILNIALLFYINTLLTIFTVHTSQ